MQMEPWITDLNCMSPFMWIFFAKHLLWYHTIVVVCDWLRVSCKVTAIKM